MPPIATSQGKKKRRDRLKQHRQGETDKQKKTHSFLGVYSSFFFFLVTVLLDVHECSLSKSICDVNADCKNTRGPCRCLCKPVGLPETEKRAIVS